MNWRITSNPPQDVSFSVVNRTGKELLTFVRKTRLLILREVAFLAGMFDLAHHLHSKNQRGHFNIKLEIQKRFFLPNWGYVWFNCQEMSLHD